MTAPVVGPLAPEVLDEGLVRLVTAFEVLATTDDGIAGRALEEEWFDLGDLDVLEIDDELPEHDCPFCDDLEFEGFEVLDDAKRAELRRGCADLRYAEATLTDVRRRLHDGRPRLPQRVAQLRESGRAIERSMSRVRAQMRRTITGEPAPGGLVDLWAR